MQAWVGGLEWVAGALEACADYEPDRAQLPEVGLRGDRVGIPALAAGDRHGAGAAAVADAAGGA